LVDISRITELRLIELEGDEIRIGSGATHFEVASSPLIQKRAMLLAEAAFAVGSPQIRNQGTLTGNIVNAQPAADTAVALFSLNAKVEIANTDGIKTVPIENLYQGIGVSRIDSTAEIVTAIQFQYLKDNQGSAFQRLAQRKALALPMLSVAAVVTLNNTHFDEARITLAPVASLPLRSRKAEAALTGAPIGPESIGKAAELAASEAQPRDSALRGTTEYRLEMVKVLARRALTQAIQRAK
jgi:carbon-monoxide dehydrogenase medium subunit